MWIKSLQLGWLKNVLGRERVWTVCRLEQKEVFLNDPFRKFIEADSKYVPFSELWISRDWPNGCETGKRTVRHVPTMSWSHEPESTHIPLSLPSRLYGVWSTYILMDPFKERKKWITDTKLVMNGNIHLE